MKYPRKKRSRLFVFASLLLVSLVAFGAHAGKLLDEMKVPDTCGTVYADKLSSCIPFRCTKPSPLAMMFGFPPEAELKKMPAEKQQKIREYMVAAEKKMEGMSPQKRATMKAGMVSTLEIKGYDAQGRCQTYTGGVSTEGAEFRMDCSLNAEQLGKVTDFTRANAGSTHIVIDTESDNPLQQAVKNGQCKMMDKDSDVGWMPQDEMNRMSHFEFNLSEHGRQVDGHIQILNAADGKVLFDKDVKTSKNMRKINLKPGTFDIKVTSKNSQLAPVWFRKIKLGEANVFTKNVEFYAITGTLKLTLKVNGKPTNMAVYMTDPESHKWLYLKAPIFGKKPSFYFKSSSIKLPDTLTGKYEVFVTSVAHGFEPPKDAKYEQFLLTIKNGETVEKTFSVGKDAASPRQAESRKATSASTNTLFILDGSGSMWGQIKGKPKITIAKEVMAKLVPELSDNARIGLLAYGHRRKADCSDVETLVQPGTGNKQAVLNAVQGLSAKGKTPLNRAVNQAFKILQREKQPATIILVSDGIESCDANPCESVKAAKKYGMKFILHTVGFGLSKKDSAQLECMAKAGDGEYFQANNADELLKSTRKALQPMGGIKVTAKVNGKVNDVLLRIVDIATGKVVHENVLPSPSGMTTRLLPGKYNVTVKPGGVNGVTAKMLSNIEITSAKIFDKTLSFDKGRLKLSITRKGKPVHALIHIEDHASHQWVYESSTFGVDTPITVDLQEGRYDIVFQADTPEKRVENISVTARKTIVKNIPADDKPVNAGADKNTAYQLNTDLPGGGDFAHIIPASDNAKLCQQACMQKKQCRSWTYVKPDTIQGASPNCWLKQAVPAAVSNNCCISGVK